MVEVNNFNEYIIGISTQVKVTAHKNNRNSKSTKVEILGIIQPAKSRSDVMFCLQSYGNYLS